jgi:hypothetical protein
MMSQGDLRAPRGHPPSPIVVRRMLIARRRRRLRIRRCCCRAGAIRWAADCCSWRPRWILHMRGCASAFEMRYDYQVAPGDFGNTIERERA